jgi:hypothetical protein
VLQLLLAVFFIAMILAPAVVAARSGKKELEPESGDGRILDAISSTKSTPAIAAKPVQLAQAKRTARKADAEKARPAVAEVATLPIHHTLGLAGR